MGKMGGLAFGEFQYAQGGVDLLVGQLGRVRLQPFDEFRLGKEPHVPSGIARPGFVGGVLGSRASLDELEELSGFRPVDGLLDMVEVP